MGLWGSFQTQTMPPYEKPAVFVPKLVYTSFPISEIMHAL
jgi:hypothetical protein